MPCYGDWNWYVDSYHSRFHVELKLSCRAAVASEDCRAVAVLVAVDNSDCLLISLGAHYSQNWSEDFVFITAHTRLYGVEQRCAQEKSLPGSYGMFASVN